MTFNSLSRDQKHRAGNTQQVYIAFNSLSRDQLGEDGDEVLRGLRRLSILSHEIRYLGRYEWRIERDFQFSLTRSATETEDRFTSERNLSILSHEISSCGALARFAA